MGAVPFNDSEIVLPGGQMRIQGIFWKIGKGYLSTVGIGFSLFFGGQDKKRKAQFCVAMKALIRQLLKKASREGGELWLRRCLSVTEGEEERPFHSGVGRVYTDTMEDFGTMRGSTCSA